MQFEYIVAEGSSYILYWDGMLIRGKPEGVDLFTQGGEREKTKEKPTNSQEQSSITHPLDP